MLLPLEYAQGRWVWGKAGSATRAQVMVTGASKGVCVFFFFFIPFGILKSSLMSVSLTDNHENIFLLKIKVFSD